jgi:hypothetical protein
LAKVDVQAAHPDNSARGTTEIENDSLPAQKSPGPIAASLHSSGLHAIHNPARWQLFPALWLRRDSVKEGFSFDYKNGRAVP